VPPAPAAPKRRAEASTAPGDGRCWATARRGSGIPYSRYARSIFDESALAYAQKYGHLFEARQQLFELDTAMLDISISETRGHVEYSLGWVAHIADVLEQRGIPLVIAMYPWLEQLQDQRLLADL
jgi:hypothetical protein